MQGSDGDCIGGFVQGQRHFLVPENRHGSRIVSGHDDGTGSHTKPVAPYGFYERGHGDDC